MKKSAAGVEEGKYSLNGNVLKVRAKEIKGEAEPEFEKLCRDLLMSKAAELVIDLSAAEYVNSTCIGMIAAVFFEAHRVGKKLRVRGRRRVADLLKLCGFDEEGMIVVEVVD